MRIFLTVPAPSASCLAYKVLNRAASDNYNFGVILHLAGLIRSLSGVDKMQKFRKLIPLQRNSTPLPVSVPSEVTSRKFWTEYLREVIICTSGNQKRNDTKNRIVQKHFSLCVLCLTNEL